MNSHLVAVKVSVKSGTDQRVKLDRFTLNQLRFKRLDTKTVKRWCTVEHDRVFADHLIKNVPNFRAFFLNKFLCLFDRRREAFCVETRIDKRLEQLQRHLLGQAAFMQFQLRANNDHRTTGIIDAFTKQVLTEPALLAFQHIGQ